MAKRPSESDYVAIIRQYEAQAETYVRDLNLENEENYDYYFREPFGNEVPGESQAVSSDCFDVVEADMPALVRSFLAGGDIMEFVPHNTGDEAQILEAKQKTAYVNRVILDGNFSVFYDWFKGAEISNFSVVTYYVEEEKRPEILRKEGLSQIEYDQLLNTFQDDDQIEAVEILEDFDPETGEVELKVVRNKQRYVIEWIPEESFLMVPARSIEDSPMVGHEVETTKGDLVAKFPKKRDEIKELSVRTLESHNDIADTKERQISQGPDDTASAPAWYAEPVVLRILCVRIDKDGDGYAERRRILKAGEIILEDEPFDHVNYALLSCYPIPGKAIGKSRVAITRETQRQKSYLQRGIFNNIATVNRPMIGVNVDPKGGSTIVSPDDLLTRRLNGVVRVHGDPSAAMFPVPTEYIGTQALEVIQYVDYQRAQTTGALMASQGINKDSIYSKETATRFQGVTAEGADKLELVMRVFAETGIKRLYEGVAWLVQNYQNTAVETKIAGQQIEFNPAAWKYDNVCKPRVGLAAADTAELKANLGVVLQLLQGMKMSGSPIADETKIYNVLKKLLNAMGVYDISEFANNPEIPAETAQAELEQARMLIAQMQQQMQSNPLAEAETIKAQARMMEVQAKDQTDRDKARANMLAEQGRLEVQRAELAQREREFRAKYALDITKVELEHKRNLEGGLDEQRSNSTAGKRS